MAKKQSGKKTSKNKSSKTLLSQKNILITSIVVIIVLIVVLVGVVVMKSKAHQTASHSSAPVMQVTDQGVTWLPEKQEIKIDKQLFTPDWDPHTPITYYKIGEDNGKDIIIAILPGIDPSGDRKITLLHDGDTYRIIQQYSNVFNQGTYFGPPHSGDVDESGFVTYHALSAPENMQLSQGLLYHVGEGYSTFFFSDYQKQEEGRKTILTKFTDTPWGPLYTYNLVIQGNGSTDTPGFYPTLQQFVLQLADGEARTYQMHPQFIGDDNVLLGTWNDGTKNTDAFTWNMTNGGCGASGFVEVLPDKEVADLVQVGKTVNGEIIYGFSTAANPTLKGHYGMLPNGTYYFYDSKSGESKQIPISIEEYNAKHGVVVYKDSFGRYDVFVNQAYGIGAECGKPVIYLYPTQTTPVSVQVGANITKSEPLYNNGWNVLAHPSGVLQNSDGKQYNSLFWEGLGKGEYPNVDAGFVVPQSELKAMIWNQTHQLGLNDQEAKDFMDFWMPKMPTTPYVRLTWFGTKQMDELAPLTVVPKPDTEIRLFLEFSGLQKQITIPSQVLSSPPRKGFTLVEWGGLLRNGQ
ncbi:MAG TPA: hypothetical protein VLG69_00735 [Candidatus Andersenbacteria bacterium]|nr:hypothetical protein [Candidatus Andersenbacteria bacterium]